MKTRTFIELLTLSSNLYMIAKDEKTMEKIHELSQKGKDAVNSFVNEKITDSDGNELEFVDKMLFKMHEAKEELENKIEHVVHGMYEKLHIAHAEQINELEQKIEALSKQLSLANSKIEELSSK
ncbi:MAG: hypothetical protein ACO2Z9_09660 [Crocinitomicaceae bacterium]